MAFRTNRMPVLQEKSASGAVATFNTALAMPLVECKVSFSATQTGTGTPSPDNVRPIISTQNVIITDEVNTHTFYLGGNYYCEGVLDVDNNKFTATDIIIKITSSSTITLAAVGEIFFVDNIFRIYNQQTKMMCNCLEWSGYNASTTSDAKARLSNHQFSACTAIETPQRTRLFMKFTEYTSADQLKEFIDSIGSIDVRVAFTSLIEIPLTPEQIRTIIGDNTISTNIGSLSLTFKDLDIAKRGNFREVFKLPS